MCLIPRLPTPAITCYLTMEIMSGVLSVICSMVRYALGQEIASSKGKCLAQWEVRVIRIFHIFIINFRCRVSLRILLMGCPLNSRMSHSIYSVSRQEYLLRNGDFIWRLTNTPLGLATHGAYCKRIFSLHRRMKSSMSSVMSAINALGRSPSAEQMVEAVLSIYVIAAQPSRRSPS